MDLKDTITKRALWRYVNIKIKRTIHHYHVFAVISILFEEMLKDLKEGKEIEIFNLGTLVLNKTKPRLYHNVNEKKMMLSKGNKILRFNIKRKIKKILISKLDVEKTFPQSEK